MTAHPTLIHVLGLGFFTAFVSHLFLATTSSFNDGHKLPATEGARWCYLDFEDASRMLGLHGEGIQQTKEALEINERLGNIFNQAECWGDLSGLFCSVGQLEAAEKAGSRAIELLPEEAKNSVFLNFIKVSVEYTRRRRRKRGRFTISRRPSGSRPLSNGPANYFRFITASQRSFWMKMGSIMHILTLIKPSCTRLGAHTTWVGRWRGRLKFGIDNDDSNTQPLRLLARSRYTRSSGHRMTL